MPTRILFVEQMDTYDLQLCLDFSQFPACQDLYVRADLFPRSRLSCSELNVSGDEFVSTWKQKGKYLLLLKKGHSSIQTAIENDFLK